MVISSIQVVDLPLQSKIQRSSQILAIPRFQISKKKRKVTIPRAHSRLITSSTFEAKVQAKDNKDATRILEAGKKKRAKEKESKR